MKQNVKKRFYQIIASCFSIGYFPIAPGTLTSFIAMTTLYFLPPISAGIFLIILNLIFFLGTLVAEKLDHLTQKHDHPTIVIDEWFGMWISLFLVPQKLWLYLLAFVIFRFFDILKPKPISSIEKTIVGGLGVMLDDACAGIFTLIIIHGILFFL